MEKLKAIYRQTERNEKSPNGKDEIVEEVTVLGFVDDKAVCVRLRNEEYEDNGINKTARVARPALIPLKDLEIQDGNIMPRGVMLVNGKSPVGWW